MAGLLHTTRGASPEIKRAMRRRRAAAYRQQRARAAAVPPADQRAVPTVLDGLTGRPVTKA